MFTKWPYLVTEVTLLCVLYWLKWWKSNCAASLVCYSSADYLGSASFSSCKKGFSLLSSSFGDEQTSALQNYIKTFIMLQYNKRPPKFHLLDHMTFTVYVWWVWLSLHQVHIDVVNVFLSLWLRYISGHAPLASTPSAYQVWRSAKSFWKAPIDARACPHTSNQLPVVETFIHLAFVHREEETVRKREESVMYWFCGNVDMIANVKTWLDLEDIGIANAHPAPWARLSVFVMASCISPIDDVECFLWVCILKGLPWC